MSYETLIHQEMFLQASLEAKIQRYGLHAKTHYYYSPNELSVRCYDTSCAFKLADIFQLVSSTKNPKLTICTNFQLIHTLGCIDIVEMLGCATVSCINITSQTGRRLQMSLNNNI